MSDPGYIRHHKKRSRIDPASPWVQIPATLLAWGRDAFVILSMIGIVLVLLGSAWNEVLWVFGRK